MARSSSRFGPPCTVVVKLGTSSIVHEKTHQPLLSTLSSVVETVIQLKKQGHKVVLVSSGAIGVGLKRMDMPSRPKSLSGKQALAAIGQGRLIALWDNLFGQLEQPIAQVLLTRGDISDRTRYLNAINTLQELISMGVVPIVNENDTVSVSEIKFGDNDTLSAITAAMIHADYLFLLTDVDGLYTANPRKDPNAKIIEEVESVSAIRSQVSTTTLGSNLGTGGMETKLIAADIATAAGVTTAIISSKHPENILGVIEYHQRNSTKAFSEPSSPREPLSGRTSPALAMRKPDDSFGNASVASGRPAISRPPHTLFKASPTPLRDLKSWTSHTLFPAGSVIIDAGAHLVLSRRESGGRLLAVGVRGILGAFASGQAVRICIARGDSVSSASQEAAREEYAKGLGLTRPGTPTMTSPSEVASAQGGESSSYTDGYHTVPDDDLAGVGSPEYTETEVVEVGRGLASYNSAQIMRVKGLNSSLLTQVLGYADSEYVVENVTIRVHPS